ncbi:hypothetical protein QR680_014544 [Steinernema hermaphroditum]|uniref:Uncharacterized protein n=1 Tax=Steinernema hermaphroditum TaxID=289476 RepID=A0AA39IBW6_9BILA|nr:hypothetical protein QR680_014544 [Steinernema hermaphroditum]
MKPISWHDILRAKFQPNRRGTRIKTNADPDVAKFYYEGENRFGERFLFRAFPLGDSIRPYVGETDNPFSGTLLPGALYKPRSPLGAMLKKLFNRYDMTQFLYEWIYLNQDEINSCTSVYQDGTAEIKAFRLMAKSLSKNGQKIGRFTELQWFFIAHRMHSCRYDEIVKTDELAELRTNPDFRKAFGCKSH